MSKTPVYRYHAPQTDGLRYAFSTDPGLSSGWTKNGIVFQVPNYES